MEEAESRINESTAYFRGFLALHLLLANAIT
jgi:hypothetical protein